MRAPNGRRRGRRARAGMDGGRRGRRQHVPPLAPIIGRFVFAFPVGVAQDADDLRVKRGFPAGHCGGGAQGGLDGRRRQGWWWDGDRQRVRVVCVCWGRGPRGGSAALPQQVGLLGGVAHLVDVDDSILLRFVGLREAEVRATAVTYALWQSRPTRSCNHDRRALLIGTDALSQSRPTRFRRRAEV